MSILLPNILRIASFLALLILSTLPVSAAEDAWQIWKSDGVHALMRHAIAPGTGDPANFTLGDCSTQRNLNETGREQARNTGNVIRSKGILISSVMTSQWCRCVDTARLLDVGPVAEEPALNSFFRDRSTEPTQTRKIKQLLAGLADGEKRLLVTHQVNITALTGIFPRSGEIILIRLADETADIEVLARLMP
ncbi:MULTISPECIES: histidine phosphatase family protein [Thalassospira]|uniref:Phosphohistidine phosphatase n=1 Tax=Thalassospira profundimaris TaxID=502049 RepID=A0A367V5T8_9PROT|nr:MULTISPECIES: histidine phosphatase family protein [Thalassospira]KZB72875.1 histidine phosphatase family protein [Thalassospira sp. MCCC 1A01148]MBR9900086.1 histidine phosphatase family protein [Rhodospirillales bacterium]RCK20564.1 phosphohistidine phosphatase [Thalassospira profundimaris]|tara:strand:- start:19230 stop:19808 length:579 start_codon:yes stop_codon:yes gene_type:complete